MHFDFWSLVIGLVIGIAGMLIWAHMDDGNDL